MEFLLLPRILLSLALCALMNACASPSEPAPQQTERYRTDVVTRAMVAKYHVTPERIATVLTADPDDHDADRDLARWGKRTLVVGLTRYPGAYAGDAANLLLDLEDGFAVVGRRLEFCLRQKDEEVRDVISNFHTLRGCGNRQVDIELVMDATDRPKSERKTFVPPYREFRTGLLAEFWEENSAAINAHPSTEMCSYAVVLDRRSGPGIVGAAAIVRSRSQEVGSGHRHLCTNTLTYALLGAQFVKLDPADISTAFVPELLELLYSDKLTSGLSRDEVRSILEAALPQ